MSKTLSPNATSVQTIREQLSALIGACFPEVSHLQVKHNGWFFSIRARYKGRRIRSKAYNPKFGIVRFFEDLNQKVYLDSYLES
jgi:hypothetical protein